MPIVDIRSL